MEQQYKSTKKNSGVRNVCPNALNCVGCVMKLQKVKQKLHQILPEPHQIEHTVWFSSIT